MKVTRERMQAMLAAKESGMTFAEMGRKFGICRNHARQIYLRAERDKIRIERDPMWGLSTRTSSALHCRGFDEREKIRKAFEDGTLKQAIRLWHKFGKTSFREVARWLDMPRPILEEP